MNTKTAIAAVLAAALVIGATPALASLAANTTPIAGETPVSTDQTPTIILADTSGTTNVDLSDYSQGSTLDIETAEGNITVTGDDGASARLATADIEGTQTQVTQISAGSNWVNLNPADKQRMDVRGDADALAFESITVDDGNTDIQLTGTQGGTAELRLYGLSATTDYGLYDASRDEYLGAFTTDASGVGQTDVRMPDGSHALQLRTASQDDAPTLSNPSPTGQVTSQPASLSVNVKGHAWPVNVSFYLDGSFVGSDTLTSNGTASTSVGATTLGEHTWTANSTDGLDQQTNLSATYETPSNIRLLEEHAPQQLVNNSTVTIRFFTTDGDVAIQRQTSDGRLDLDGLPDSAFVMFIESPDHYDRRIFLQSIFNQKNAYLLNETEFSRADNDAIRSRFVYEDLTGEFPREDTTIQIERAIDLDGDDESQFRVVAGDYWGASNEFQDILEYGERYRIVLVNQETGARTVQGTHHPIEDLTHTIRLSGLVEEAADASSVVGLAELNESSQVIDLAYGDPGNQTESLTVRIENQSGGVLFNDTVNTTLGTYSNSVSLNSSEVDQDWIVIFDAGERHRSAIPVGSGAIGLPVAVPSWLLTLLMSMAVTFVGALYGPRTALLGAWAMVAAAGGIAMFGWAFSTASVVIAALVAVAVTLLAASFP